MEITQVVDYWREVAQDLGQINSLNYAAAVIRHVLGKMKKDGRSIVQICGPMTTGGLGNMEDNVLRLKRAIVVAEERGILVFNQTHLQEAISRIAEETKLPVGSSGYYSEIIQPFYGVVFGSGVREGWFLPGWEDSNGCVLERQMLRNFDLLAKDYPVEWLALL